MILERTLCVSAWLALVSTGCISPPSTTRAPRFVFENSFWVNLHHCLRAEARRWEGGAELAQPLEELGADEQESWTNALKGLPPAGPVDGTLVRWVEEESARQGLEPPPDLWHAILFYTSGELSARALGRAGT